MTIQTRLIAMIAVIFLACLTLHADAQTDDESPIITPQNAQNLETIAILGRGTIEDVAYSPDGMTIAVAGSAGIWVYDVNSPNDEPRLFEGHTNIVTTIAFSPDGSRLVSASYDATAIVWDIAIGQPIFTLQGDGRGVLDVAYSPDGTQIATASNGGTARLWDATTGAEQHALSVYARGILTVLYSPDSKTITTISSNHFIHVWDTQTGDLQYRIYYDATYLAYSPDGRFLAASSINNNLVKVWDVETGDLIHTVEASTRNIKIQFNTDNHLMIEVGGIQTWDVTTGELINTVENGNFDGYYIDNQFITREGVVLDLEDYQGKEPYDAPLRYGGGLPAIERMLYSPNGQTILTKESLGIRLWDAQSGQLLMYWHDFTNSMGLMMYRPDGEQILTRDRNIRLWDSEEFIQEHIFYGGYDGHANALTSVAYSTDSRLLSFSSWLDMGLVANTDTGAILRHITGTTNNVQVATHSPTGGLLAYGAEWSPDGAKMNIWDVTTGNLVLAIPLLDYPAMAFSPDNNLFVILYRDDVLLWDLEQGEIRHHLPITKNYYSPAILFSPDNRYIASAILTDYATEYTHILIWDVNTGEQLYQLKINGRVSELAYSPDGTRIISDSTSGLIHIWDAQTGTLLHTLTGHDERIADFAISPNGQFIASAGQDKKILLWDMQTGELLMSLIGHKDEVLSIAFSPDGTQLASASNDGTVRIWGIVP